MKMPRLLHKVSSKATLCQTSEASATINNFKFSSNSRPRPTFYQRMKTLRTKESLPNTNHNILSHKWIQAHMVNISNKTNQAYLANPMETRTKSSDETDKNQKCKLSFD